MVIHRPSKAREPTHTSWPIVLLVVISDQSAIFINGGIVAGRAEVGILRDDGLLTEGDEVLVVADNVGAEAGAALHAQLPWCPDADGGIDVGCGVDVRSEEA